MKTYSEKLKDPRWQRKRLEIMSRDYFACTECGDHKSTLNVHHWRYKKDPWEADDNDLTTLCERCHGRIENLKKDMETLFRDSEFRDMISKIVNFATKTKISYSSGWVHQQLFKESQAPRPKTAGKGFRFLNDGEIIKAGDEFFCQAGNGFWETYGSAVGHHFVDIKELPAGRRKVNHNPMSDPFAVLDAMIDQSK